MCGPKIPFLSETEPIEIFLKRVKMETMFELGPHTMIN